MSRPKGKLSEQELHIQRLERKIKRLEKDRKRLQSENATLNDAWKKTEAYLLAVSKEKSISDIFEEIETKTNLTKINKECPNCGKQKMRKTDYDGFSIEACTSEKCGYRNRVHEKRSKRTE